MNTKSVPTIIMLVAGLVACIVMIKTGVSNQDFVRILLFVLITFLIVGWIVKFILDKYLKKMGPPEEESDELTDEQTEESLEELDIPTDEDDET